MEEQKKAKLQHFANDKPLNQAVYDVLLGAFLKEKSQYDVYTLAAERLAVDFLKKAWKEIEAYRLDNKTDEKASVNIGL